MTASIDDLLHRLESATAAAADVDLADPEIARRDLERLYPSGSDSARVLRELLVQAVRDGLICDRGDDAIRYSRLAKPGPHTHGMSVDCVWMSGPGIPHRHPNGEINLCFAVEGEPRFDGQPEGWVAFAPGSEHVPTVSGGRMLIVYFLPEGSVEWIKAGA